MRQTLWPLCRVAIRRHEKRAPFIPGQSVQAEKDMGDALTARLGNVNKDRRMRVRNHRGQI